jgi:hypothetical protein
VTAYLKGPNARLRGLRAFSVLLWCALVMAGPVNASTVAYSFQTALVASDSPLSFGFEFSTTQAVTVYALGYYDYSGTGFLTPHEVGIFDSGGTLLSSALLAPGAGDPLLGGFRYQDIAPLFLPAGGTYTIAATSGGSADMWAYGAAGSSIMGFVTDPAIQIDQLAGVFLYQDDNILRDPTQHYTYTLYGGPNFVLGTNAASAVPEPNAGTLLGPAVLILSAVARRLRSRIFARE